MHDTHPSRRAFVAGAAALAALPLFPGVALARMPADEALFGQMEDAFGRQLSRDPLMALRLGFKQDMDRLGDPSDAFAAEGVALQRQDVARFAKEFPPESLSPAMRLYARLYAWQAGRAEAGQRWRGNELVLNTTGGPHVNLPVQLINQHRVDDRADAEAYIARLRAFPEYFGKVVARLASQQAAGVLPPRFFFPVVTAAARNQVTGRPFDASDRDCPLFADLRKKIGALPLPEGEKDALLRQAADALVGAVGPAYAGLLTWLAAAETRAGEDDGAWRLPDGEAYYAHALEQQTTTRLTADEVHRIGLEEVARIHGEMREIMGKVGFTGDLQAFFRFLRDDPRFYHEDSDAGREAYLAEARAHIDAMGRSLDGWFGLRPKAGLEVRAVEKFREGSAASAFYNNPSQDGTRPGIFYVNLGNLKARPKYGLESLAYHEGIPGHHMQIAIQQELEGVPSFQRLGGGIAAYAEGWALYTELLAKEMGFYVDPYSDFGRLNAELWRSIRLVVDTGIHAKRWTREQATRYFVENSPMDEGGARREIDRYIGNPGQACAYKIGMNRMLELRAAARARMGSRFDIRGFHDAVLRNGRLPLDMLAEQVGAWSAA